MTVPLTASPICRLLTPGKRPPWKAYRQSIVYRPLVGTTTLLNVMRALGGVGHVDDLLARGIGAGRAEHLREPAGQGLEPVEAAEQGVLGVVDLAVAGSHAGRAAAGSDRRRRLRRVLGGAGGLAAGVHRGDLVEVDRRGAEVLVGVESCGRVAIGRAALAARRGATVDVVAGGACARRPRLMVIDESALAVSSSLAGAAGTRARGCCSQRSRWACADETASPNGHQGDEPLTHPPGGGVFCSCELRSVCRGAPARSRPRRPCTAGW